MIEKIDISGSNFKVEESFKKYVEKRIGKLDRYLPRQNRNSLNIPGGKVLAAKDEASNIFAGIDIIEAKLTGQIRRYKTENTNYDKKGFLKRFLKK